MLVAGSRPLPAAVIRQVLTDAQRYQELKRRNAHRAADMLTFLRIADAFAFPFCFEHATVARAVEAGLTVAVTSDHGVSPIKYLQVYLALAIREGLPAERALELVTINPARILGVDRRLGSIEGGKEADLVVWEGVPLDIRTRPFQVYIAGRLFDADARALRPVHELWDSAR